MKIAFNPSTVAALTTPPNNKDITFDLRGRNIFARGVKFCGTDTNTWRDIKINNVSIDSNTLDLRNGSNTTLTNTNGIVTINSTWRPVVDNLTSDSTTSSLSANQGRVLKALIDGKSDSDHNHDDRYVKKSGDTMSGVLTIDTTNFGALIIQRNDDDNGASIQFRGKSSVYGYIGLNNSTKDKQFLRWGSDTSKTYTILDTSSTYVSNGKGIINGTTITQVSNADTTDGVHLEWSGQLTYDQYSWLAGWTNDGKKIKAVNKSQFATSGHTHDDRYLKLSGGTMTGIIRATNRGGSWISGRDHCLIRSDDKTSYSYWSAILAIATVNGYWTLGHLGDGGERIGFNYDTDADYNAGRNNNHVIWLPTGGAEGTLALTSDIPSSLKNPYSLTTFGVVYDGSTAKTVTTSTFISQVTEGTSTVTDGTMFITSWASDNGFADTNAVNVPYKRKAIHLWEYIKAKTDSLYATKGHNHDDRYLKLTGGIMTGTIYRNSGGSTISGRDHAIIRQTYAPGGSSWNPIACVDTETGTWTLGHLSSGDSDTNFHFCFSTNTDYNAGNNNGNYVTLRNKVGTIALLSEIPDKNSWNYDDRYLKLTGGTMNGNARIGYGSGNLYIGNSGNDGWVAVQDICSQDSIGDGKWSIRVNGTASFQSIKFPSNRLIAQVSSGSNSPLKGIKLPDLQNSGIGIFSRVGNGSDEGGIVLSEDTCVIYNSFDTGWGLSVRDKDITQTDISGDNTIAFGVRQDYRAYSLGGFEKSGSDNSYVLLGGGGHKALSDFSISGHTHSSITIPVCSSLDENSDIFRVEYAGGSNSVATKPSGVDAFGVIRLRTAAGWYGQIMMSANTAPGIYYRNANGLSSSVGWKKLLDSSNFNSYSPKLDGTGASGTWNISITGNANTVDNIHATGFLRWKGMQNIGSNAPFQAVVDIMKDTSKLNDGGLAFYSYVDDEYTVLIGSRNDATRHGNALKWGYANKYLWMIRMINGSPRSSDWEKISAGYADSSGNTDLLDGYHASGLFTNLSNSGNNISITIGGTNKTLTVGYASTATQVSKSLKWTDATGTVQSYNGGTEKSITSLNFPCNQIALNFRHPGDGYATKIQYMTAGNEALVFAAQNSVTSFIFKSGANITNSNLWYDQVPTPTLQLKGQSAYINKLIADGSVPAFNFLVNGSSRFDGKLWQLYSTRTDPNATCIRDSAIACFGEYDDDAMWIGNNTNNGTWIQVSFKGDEDRPSKNYLYNLSLQPLGGNVGIGTNSPTEKLTVNGWIGTNGIYTNRTGSSTDGGVSLYSNVDPMTYGIALRGTGTYGTHGYVTSAGDWATYLTMNDNTTRGWIFRRGDTNVASIAGSGNMAIGQHLEFSNGAHISTNRSTDYHYGYTFNLGDNTKSIGMYSGPVGEAGGVVISPDGCLIYNSSDCGYNLQVRDKDLGSDLTNIATLTFGIEQSGYYAWSRGGFKKNGSSDSYVLLGGGGHKLESALNVANADKVDGYHASSLVKFYLSPMANDAPADSAKNWFVNTMPSASGAIVYNVPGSEKTIIAGKSSGAHGHMLQLSYDDTYLRILRYYSGSWKSTNWEKISAGYADSAGSVSWNNITGKPSSYTPSAHTHSWTSITEKLVAGNEFNIVNAGFKEGMWFNYLPINDRSKTATITGYHFGNGATGYTSINASGFIKKGSNSNYVLLGDGGHQTISSLSVNYANSAGNADTVDGYHATSGNDKPWGTIPAITTSGWMDIGKHLEFHFDNTTGSDYSTILRCTGNYSNIVNLPSAAGTLALTSDIPTTLPANGGNADTTDGVHITWAGELTSTNYLAAWETDGSAIRAIKPSNVSVGNSDKLDGYHANGLLTALSNSNNGISITVGGTTKSVSNISVNYAASAGSANSAIQATNLTPENTPHYFRDPSNSSWRGGMYWGSAGNESMSFVAVNGGTRFQFVGGSDIANWTSSTWQSVTPYLTIYSSGIVTPGSVTATNGFIKSNSSDSYVLLGGGGHKAESSLRVAYATSAGSADTAQYLRSLGNQNCQTGRTQNYGDVYTYNTYDGNTGSPTTYTSVIGFGRGIAGTVEIAGGWDNTNLYWRSLRDCCEDWHSWRTVLDSSNYTEFINNYYWANVKISTSSSTTTSPTVSNLTATSSIKMGNIYLQNTDEINNGANGNIYLNYRNSGNVSLCQGGGSVGIGTTTPSYKLDVNGQMRASGFHHSSMNSDNYILLAGGGYSQGVPVKYWSIESISIYSSTQVFRVNRGGNYTFVTKVEPRIKGSCVLTLQFPSGYQYENTIIWARGVLNLDISDSSNSNIYATIFQFSGSKYYLNLSDDDSLNNGTCQLYFMCF